MLKCLSGGADAGWAGKLQELVKVLMEKKPLIEEFAKKFTSGEIKKDDENYILGDMANDLTTYIDDVNTKPKEETKKMFCNPSGALNSAVDAIKNASKIRDKFQDLGSSTKLFESVKDRDMQGVWTSINSILGSK